MHLRLPNMCAKRRYQTLMEELPKDEPSLNRREILAKGHGITMFQIATKVVQLGRCSCEGRENAIRTPVPAMAAEATDI
jgi:hypothetical protein